jgi:hypothetical protein
MSFPRQPQAGVVVEYMQFCRVEADRDLGTDRAPAVRPTFTLTKSLPTVTPRRTLSPSNSEE